MLSHALQQCGPPLCIPGLAEGSVLTRQPGWGSCDPEKTCHLSSASRHGIGLRLMQHAGPLHQCSPSFYTGCPAACGTIIYLADREVPWRRRSLKTLTIVIHFEAVWP